MRAILVDDEPLLLEELRGLLAPYPDIEVAGSYTEPQEAWGEISAIRPDYAFLDIEMAGWTGIDLAEKLYEINPDIGILFITAYNHYATEAFEVNAMDYLLKPIRPERLAKALNKLRKTRPAAAPSLPYPLRIQSFGRFEVFSGDRPLKWNRNKARELTAYLLQHEGRWIDKYKICDDLWREYEPERAIANLQTSIWAIRKNLKESGRAQIVIEFANDRYLLRAPEAQWDLQQFNDAYRAFVAGLPEMGRVAARLYNGEYLAGEDWPWADLERERYSRLMKEIKKKSGNVA